jgi:hypothetical protein
MDTHIQRQPAKFTRQILQVNAGSAVDVGGILSSEQVYTHKGNTNLFPAPPG